MRWSPSNALAWLAGRVGVGCACAHIRYSLRGLLEVHPVMTEVRAPVASACAEAVWAVLGQAAAFVASPGTYEPGVLELAHQPDEWERLTISLIPPR